MNNSSRVIILFVVAALASTASSRAADSKEIYVKNCASCHGSDGKGRTPAGKKLGVKDLTQSTLADADIEKQIVTGSKDSKGNSRMPSFKETLTQEDTAALVAFVKTLRR
jgi:mono/diheme cytochrome c family protein